MAQAAQPCNTYDGAGVSYFQVPAGVTQIEASAYGAEGGAVLPPGPQFGLPGQGGGVVGAMIPVTPGEVLEIRVGGAGVDSTGAQTPAPPGGFNGGGAGAVGSAHTSSTGGGATAIVRGSTTLVIAGGGGGAAHGGGGGHGGLVGTDGTKNAGSTVGSTPGLAGGNGGTGGAGSPASQAGGNGSAGQGGTGGGATSPLPVDGGGGGGGGAVGGGGGGGGPGNGGSGGGGGSSFDASGTATFETGVETGDGRVTLSYNCAAQPQPPACVTFDTPGTHSFQVPAWVHEVDAAVYGAQGGDLPNGSPGQWGIGGLGGGATGLSIPVTPGETLDVAVGGRGADGGGSAPPAPAGGSGGGGDGGGETILSGAGGGGASAIRRGAQTLVIVGGGGGSGRGGNGGAGGFTGTDGTRFIAISTSFPGRSGGNGGAGGSVGAGGSAGQDGSAGQGGAGGGNLSTTTATAGGGGGGGGAVGGGGGGAIGSQAANGGGGGSSAQSLGPVPVTWHTGVETGDGRVVLSYDCAGTDLSIEKQASAGTVTAGGQVMYTLIVRNHGPADDTGVTVTDSIPAGLDVVSAVAGQGSCQIAAAVTCSLGDLAAGGSTQILVTANVGSSVSGDVTNTAEVDGDRDDTDPTNNRAERKITVDPPPPPPPPAVDLKVKKSVSAGEANPGDQLTYTLVVTNDGPGDATNVKLVDTPPGEIRYVAAQTAQGKCEIDAGVLTCSLGALPADGQTQVVVTGEVQPGASGTLRNVATVTAAEEDRNPDNNLDRQDVTVPRPGGPQPSLDLRITKAASKVQPSGKVTYKLVVRNNGPDTAHDAVVVDTASRALKVLSAKTSKGKCKVGPPIRCMLGTIGNGKRVEIAVVAKLTDPGKLTNAASVSSAGADAKPKNNLAKAKSRLQPLRLVKRALATRVPKGEEVAFRIGVRNASTTALRNVRVCDPLPDGLRFESSTPRASRDGDRVCWRIAKLGAGKSRSFEVVATMVASKGRVTNRAAATGPEAGVARDSAGVQAGRAGSQCVGVARPTPRLC